MANSTHNASTQSAAVEPPDLPDGWRNADLATWKDPRLAARRRMRVVQATLVILVLAAVIGVPLWIAATHYARGVDALEVGSYSVAVQEFSAARVFVIPYRDAQTLEEQARRALAAADARRARAEAGRAAVLAQLETASGQMEAGDADTVLASLQAIDESDLRLTLEQSEAARASAGALTEKLEAAARAALRDGAWNRTERLAAAVLVLDPSRESAVALAAQARTGKDLSAKLAQAKDAARREQWRTALRLALAVLAVKGDFPGATAVVADARQALAPKPKARRPAPAATTASAPAAGPPTVTAPPAPPPP